MLSSICVEEFEEYSYIKEIKESIDLNKNIVILGPGGCGKSTVLKLVSKYLKESDSVVCFDILCPTGNSAINVDGCTYHTLFCWQSKGLNGVLFGMSHNTLISNDDEYINNRLLNPRFRANYKRIQNLNTIIFDEFSMISRDSFESMNRICQVIRGSSKPFGGIQLILFGDPMQLKPVIGEYIFESKLWDLIDFTVHEIHHEILPRFCSKEFSDMTRLIRLGILSRVVVEKLSHRVCESPLKIMELYFTNNDVDKSNILEYDKIESSEFEYDSLLSTTYTISSVVDRKIKIEMDWDSKSCIYQNCSTSKIFDSLEDKRDYFISHHSEVIKKWGDTINKIIKKDITEFKRNLERVYGSNYMCIKMKNGARVMCTVNCKNDGEFLYVNGTSGIIDECGSTYINLILDDGKKISVNYKTIERNKRLIFEDGIIVDITINFYHIPLRLAYAVTVHRSQGMTLDKVLINGTGLRKSPGLVYVSLSRCKSIENMHLSNFDFEKINVSMKAIQKFRNHVNNELKYLYSQHPDWFDNYYIMADDKTEIPILYEKISMIKNNIQDDDDDINYKNTFKENTVKTRGYDQTRLRDWLFSKFDKCIISHESLPDILEAAHIKPYCEFQNKQEANYKNGMLLRIDLHKLYDKGMITIDKDGNILKSKTINEHPLYSTYQKIEIPDWINKDYLLWHQMNIFNENL